MSDAAKRQHYVGQLERALSSGLWADSSPASSPKAEPLPWSELARKHDKHVGGNAASLALCLRSLLLYLIPDSPLPSSSALAASSPAPAPSHLHLHTQHPVPTSFLSAQAITPLNLDGGEPALADRSRSLRLEAGTWAACAAPDERRPDVEAGLNEARALLASVKTPQEKESALHIVAFHLLALGRYAESLRTSSEISSATQSATVMSVTVERVRGRVVEGIAHELSSPPSSVAALAAYTSAVHLLSSLSSPSAASGSAFIDQRELWRWAEHALYRGSVLASSSESAPVTSSLQWLRTYSHYESAWMPSFRSARRSVILTLRLRALALSQKPTALLHPSSSTSSIPFPDDPVSSAEAWRKEVQLVSTRGISLLANSGRGFPSAGESRPDIEAFVAGCLTLWEKGGERRGPQVDALLELLWWSTTQTFNSQPILRFLTRLLLASGAPHDAKRSFDLYVALVLKARETAASDEAMASPEVNGGEEVPKEEVSLEYDDDRTFVEALIFGARLVGKDCEEPKKGLASIEKAEEILAKSKERKLLGDDKLKARLLVTKGVLKLAVEAYDHNPLHRSSLQSSALAALSSAAELDPHSASAFYQLAHAQARCRQIDESTLSIRSALELQPGMVQGWHLLTLLLTAKGKWEDAARIAEIGLEAWDEDAADGDPSFELDGPERDAQDHSGLRSNDATIGTDHVLPDPSHSHHRLLSPKSELLPPPAPPPVDTPLRPTQLDSLADVLQLRMTRTMIIERLQGPDVAMAAHQDVFAFYSSRCGPASKPAAAGGLPPSTSVTTSGTIRLADSRTSLEDRRESVPRRVDFGAVDSGEHEVNALQPGVAAITVTAPAATPSAVRGTAVSDASQSPGGSLSSSSSNVSFQAPSTTAERHKSRFMPKHLLSPHSASGGSSSGGHGKPYGGLGRSASLSKLHLTKQGSTSRLNALTSADLENASQGRRTVSNASSIHSRSRRQSPSQSIHNGHSPIPSSSAASFVSTSPQTAASIPVQTSVVESGPAVGVRSTSAARETRLLSQLWLMSAATLRRSGKFDQALDAIREAEILDPMNPEVWIQLGLYHDLTFSTELAISSFTKALVHSPNSISAIVHLARLYLSTSTPTSTLSSSPSSPPSSTSAPTSTTNLALAHGLLNGLTQGPGWDCSEAWYFLSKACEMQGGREERVRECLEFAKKLEEGRAVRGVGDALPGWN